MPPPLSLNWTSKLADWKSFYPTTCDTRGIFMTRILVIDDEPINHQLVSRALVSLQCEIHFAENGKNGIAQARSLKPDVIITDVMMPDITGYEVTRILRREPQFAAKPILVLPGQAGPQAQLTTFEGGTD